MWDGTRLFYFPTMRKLLNEGIAVTVVMVQLFTLASSFVSATQNAEPPLPDMVLRWNEVLLRAQVVDHTPGANVPGAGLRRNGGPTMAARAMAMVHGAMFDAVNSIEQAYEPYLLTETGSITASKEAAIIQSAFETLSTLYPEQRATFEAGLLEDLALIPEGPEKEEGKELGSKAAQAMLLARNDDGDDSPSSYVLQALPGHWSPDPLHPDQTPYADYYGSVKPFVIQSASNFGVSAPPALSSTEYAAAFDEVKELGRKDSVVRTEEQTNIGIYWGYDGAPGLGVPPRLYNQIMRQIATERGNSQLQNARLFALGNIAMADGGIAAWKTKYDHDFWRPVTAIRAGDETTSSLGVDDGNPATIGDVTWEPLGAPASNPELSASPENPPRNFTPPFPAYTSGHATFGAAMFRILRNFYGRDDIPFTFVSDELNGVTKDQSGAVRPLLPRSFQSFSEAAYENAQSRIYLGIHWNFDRDKGIEQGTKVADEVFRTLAKPYVPRLTLTAQAPSLVIKDAPLSLTITLRSEGKKHASDARVIVTLPAGITFEEANNENCVLANGTQTVSCVHPDDTSFEPGSVRTFSVTVKAGLELCGTYASLNVAAKSVESESVTDVRTFIGCPTETQLDLSVESQDIGRTFRGEEFLGRFLVRNSGPADAHDVVLTLPLLEGVDLATSGNTPECTQNERIITCNTLNLSRGSEKEHVLRFTTAQALSCPQNLLLTAGVTSVEEDFFLENNTSLPASLSLECEPVADAKIRLSGPGNIFRDERALYTVTVSNAGPASASNVRASVPLPVGMTWSAADSSVGCQSEGASIVCSAASIAPDQEKVFSVVFVPIPSFECHTSIVQEVSLTSRERDPDLGNNSSERLSTIIQCRAPLPEQIVNAGSQSGGDESTQKSVHSSSHRGHGVTEAAMVLSFLARNHNIHATNTGHAPQFVGHFAFASDAQGIFDLHRNPFSFTKEGQDNPLLSDGELAVICGMKSYANQDARKMRMDALMPWISEKIAALLGRPTEVIERILADDAACKER